MTIPNKVKAISLISFLILSIVVNILLVLMFKFNKVILSDTIKTSEESVDLVECDDLTQLTQSLIDKECAEVHGNVWQTECVIELLDRTAAEREWKQRKIETWENYNIYEVMDLEGSIDRITDWRIDFEKARDAWCNATDSTFYFGSGTPYAVAQCQLSFEIKAINDLNYLYYDRLHDYGREDIKDFEPTKVDIEDLVKTNTTNRGCVWAGEENCD